MAKFSIVALLLAVAIFFVLAGVTQAQADSEGSTGSDGIPNFFSTIFQIPRSIISTVIGLIQKGFGGFFSIIRGILPFNLF